MSKILIVDDDPDIVKQLRAKFSKEGYDVVFAMDAYNAIQMARRERPDLIILDLMLPAGGGLHVLKHIRLMPNSAMIPVVVLTGSNDEKLKHQIEHEGVEAYVQKPYDFTSLNETVRKLIQE